MNYYLGRSTLAQDPMCQASRDVMQCANDCRTMLACVGVSGPPVLTRTCSSIDPTKPYCVKNVCQAEPDINNRNCSMPVCTSAGVFPDFTDCNKYHYCHDIAVDSNLLACSPDFVYNSTHNICSYNQNATPCAIADCTRMAGRFVVYPQNPAYYVFCGTGGLMNTMYMFKCEDIDNEIFDVSLNMCRFNCKAAGKFPDKSNWNGYIKCSPKTNETWTMSIELCNDGEIFTNGDCAVQNIT